MAISVYKNLMQLVSMNSNKETESLLVVKMQTLYFNLKQTTLS